MLEEYLPFVFLLIFGNIENLILSSQGVVKKANLKNLFILTIIWVITWNIIGVVGTEAAIQYSDIIEFIGGLAIFVLGIQAMVEGYKSLKAKKVESEE